jgi:hypothetical protein
MVDVMEASSIQFAAAARVLGDAARSQGLCAPSFRSPPRLAVDRTVRRQGKAMATVAVRVRGRPWLAVLADLVDGVVAANQLTGAEAAHCRTELWAAVERNDLARRAEPDSEPRSRRGGPTTTVDREPGWRKRHTQAA